MPVLCLRASVSPWFMPSFPEKRMNHGGTEDTEKKETPSQTNPWVAGGARAGSPCLRGEFTPGTSCEVFEFFLCWPLTSRSGRRAKRRRDRGGSCPPRQGRDPEQRALAPGAIPCRGQYPCASRPRGAARTCRFCPSDRPPEGASPANHIELIIIAIMGPGGGARPGPGGAPDRATPPPWPPRHAGPTRIPSALLPGPES